MKPGQELFKLEQEEHQQYVNQADETKKMSFFERKFQQWIAIIQNKLADDSIAKNRDPPDAGPEVELNYWKTRMQDITNWSEQLKGKDFQLVKMTLQKFKSHDG